MKNKKSKAMANHYDFYYSDQFMNDQLIDSRVCTKEKAIVHMHELYQLVCRTRIRIEQNGFIFDDYDQCIYDPDDDEFQIGKQFQTMWIVDCGANDQEIESNGGKPFTYLKTRMENNSNEMARIIKAMAQWMPRIIDQQIPGSAYQNALIQMADDMDELLDRVYGPGPELAPDDID